MFKRLSFSFIEFLHLCYIDYEYGFLFGLCLLFYWFISGVCKLTSASQIRLMAYFVNKVLLAYDHAHSFRHYFMAATTETELNSSDRTENTKLKISTIRPFMEKCCQPLICVFICISAFYSLDFIILFYLSNVSLQLCSF